MPTDVTLVYFRQSVTIPLPDGTTASVLWLSGTTDFGLLGTLDLRVHLDSRVLEIVFQTGRDQCRVWVPLEQVVSWVVRENKS